MKRLFLAFNSLGIKSNIGGHAILANKVYKSNDLEKYFIGIYDSNIPGTEKIMELERQTSYNSFSETSYYSFKYETNNNINWNIMIYCGEY